MREFKKDNKGLVKKRFLQVKAQDILSGFVKTWNRLLPNNIPDIDSFAQFVMIISWIKSRGTYPYEESIKAKGDIVAKMMQEYKYREFEHIFKIKELKTIFVLVLQNSPEDMYNSCKDKNQARKDQCIMMIDQWMTKFAKFQNEDAEADHK